MSWAQISGVSVIIEAGLEDFNIDPSQGTHFFQNMTSLGIGYLSVPWSSNPEVGLDWEWLDSLTACAETEHVRHVRLGEPTEVIMDGRTGQAVVMKPMVRGGGGRGEGQ